MTLYTRHVLYLLKMFNWSDEIEKEKEQKCEGDARIYHET